MALLTAHNAIAQFPTPVVVPVMIMTINNVPLDMSLPGPYTLPFTGPAFTLSVTGTSGAATYTGGVLNIPNYTLAGLGGVSLSALSALPPLYYTSFTGQFSIPSALTNRDGYLLQADWNTFNNKQNAITFSTTGSSGAATFSAGALNIPNYTLSGLGGISLASLSASAPLSYNNTTGAFTIAAAGSSANGYLSSTDWNTFNGKIGLGALSASAPLSYNSGTGGFSIPAANTSTDGYLAHGDWNLFNGKQRAITFTTTGTSGAATFSSGALNIPNYTLAGLGGISLSALSATAPLGYNSSTGVFSVSAASGSTAGALSSTDWNTFNNKQNAVTLTTTGSSGAATFSGGTLNVPTYTLAGLGGISLASLGATAPLGYNSSTGVFSVSAASGSTAGTLSSTDWNTFNNKQNAVTLTTTGSTGAATFSGGTLNIPIYTLSGLGGGPGGSSGNVQYNNGSGGFSGTANMLINSSEIDLLSRTYSVTPAAPAAGYARPYADNSLGRDELFVQPSVGNAYGLQPLISEERKGEFTTNGTALQTIGFYASAISTAGTAAFSLMAYDATNLATNRPYYKLTGSASTNISAELYYGFASRDAMIGNAAYGAGSRLTIICYLPAYVSTQRFFAGFANSTAQMSTTTDPSSVLNIVGVGKDAGDATLQIMFNNGSGTATKVNTGITPTVNDEYVITVLIPSNGATEYVEIKRRTKTAETKFAASNSAKVPAAGTMLYMHAMSNSAAASTAPVIAVSQVIDEEFY